MKQEFKQKYFTNNFYWVNKNNYRKIQEIAIELGCLLHTGQPEIIGWHEGFKNIGFRTRGGQTFFQKEAFLTEKENATDYDAMLSEYNTL